MRAQLTILKVGGKIVENEGTLSALVRSFSALSGPRLLVHGGGRTATDVAARLGLQTVMVEGRRVTDADMLRVVTMVYGGLVNKQIVARLAACGVPALGLTGADMDVIRSHRRTGTAVDYGFVGDVDRVDGERLAQLLQAGVVPVMAPLTHDGAGQLLNTNADTIAAEVARALASRYEVTLIYCFEHAGVLRRPDDEVSLIPDMDRAAFEALKADGTVSGGMIPKLENCFAAVQAGVARVLISRADSWDTGRGTWIHV